jgi:hypothetical protein
MLEILGYLYIFFSFIWACYCVRMEVTYYGEQTELKSMFLAFFLNLVGAPIGVIISIYNRNTFK